MICPLKPIDYQAAIHIVNENWKTVYQDYVSPLLLSEEGCCKRTEELLQDFETQRLSEYVWKENGHVLALLSFGDTVDEDASGAFEIWHIYVDSAAQGHGIGRQLLLFAEEQARQQGYRESIIWAFKGNTKATAFYLKNGYQPDKEEFLPSPYFADAIRFRKKL